MDDMFELVFPVVFLIVVFNFVRSKQNEREIKSLKKNIEGYQLEIKLLKSKLTQFATNEADGSLTEKEQPDASSPHPTPEAESSSPMLAQNLQADIGPAKRPMPASFAPKNVKAESPTAPQKPIKKGPGFFDRALASFKANWVIWLAALSLALGGLYFIQYSIENNLVSPSVRLAIATLFGFGLLAFANHIRSKPFAELQGFYSVPAAFAGAAIAILFGTALATHMVYGYTQGLLAFASIAGVAVAAIALGLRFGPMVSVIGVLGAFVSPLLVRGGALSPTMIVYLLGVLLAALLVERVQKWIWLSAFATGLALFWTLPLYSLQGEGLWLSIYLGAIALSVICIPAFNFPPNWQDTTMLSGSSLRTLSKSYPTVLAVLGAGLSIVLIACLPIHGQVESVAQSSVLVVFAFFAIYLFRRAQNLDQLALIIGVALLAVIARNQQDYIFEHAIGGASGATLFLIILPAILFFAAAFVRAPVSVRPKYWMLIAALFPALFVMLQLNNLSPYGLIGPDKLLAQTVLCLAYLAGMVALLARKTESAKFGADMFAIIAHLVAFAILVIHVETEWLPHINLALSISLMSSATRFNFKFARYVASGFVGISLVSAATQLYPKLLWHADVGHMLLTLLALLALCAAGYAVVRKQKMRMAYESYGLFLIALIVAGLIMKLMQPRPEAFNYLSLSLMACATLILAVSQYAYARQSEGIFQKIRAAIAIFYAVISGANMFGAIRLSPFVSDDPIVGPFLLDSVMLAYGLPMLVIWGLYRFMLDAEWREKLPARYPLTALALFVMVQEVRHFWHGDLISWQRGFAPGELYTYTVMLMGLTFFFIGQAVWKKSENLKRLGLIFAGCTAAKVFLVDTSGMEGITRATIMVLLGFSLAAIYWLLQVSFKSKDNGEEA